MRNAVRSASSKEDLAAQWRDLSIPPLPAALQAQPLSVIRAQLNRTFTQMQAALEQQHQQAQRKNAPIQNLALVNGRQMLASLLYALAFAAGGQRSRSPIFTGLPGSDCWPACPNTRSCRPICCSTLSKSCNAS